MAQPTVFKFLDSYAKEDGEVFFGRESETEEIYQRCSFSKTLVVYGRSGTGKTSIIRCGLGNAFNDQDWLPVFVRRSTEINRDTIRAIRGETVSGSKAENSLSKEVRNLYLDHFKPVYLIFDQFEELFIFGGSEEIETFFASIKSLIESDQDVHLIFVIREEYLAYLTEAEEVIPEFLENRIRIEHLTAVKLRETVEKMCEAAGIKLEEGFSEELTERMTSGKAPLELSYLQVYLDSIRKKYPDTNRFSKEMIEALGSFGDVLGDFLQRQLNEQPDPAKAETVLKAFVSAQGTKRLIDTAELKQLTAEFGVLMETTELDTYVNRFIDGRILRQVGEDGKYELRHDTLAKVIYERITLAEKELLEAKQFVHNAYNRFQKNGTQLRDEDLDYLAPYAKRLYLKDEQKKFLNEAFARKERRQKRKLRLTQVGVGILLLLLIGAGYLLYQNYQDSQLQARIDESHRLAKLSKSDEIGDPMLAFLLAEKAHEIYEGPHTHNALLEAYDNGGLGIKNLPGDFVIVIDSSSFISYSYEEKRIGHFSSIDGSLIETMNSAPNNSFATEFTTLGVWTGRDFIRYNGDTIFSASDKQNPELIPVENSKWEGIISEGSSFYLIDSIGRTFKKDIKFGLFEDINNKWFEIFNDTLLFRDSIGFKFLPLDGFIAQEVRKPNLNFWRKKNIQFPYEIEESGGILSIKLAGHKEFDFHLRTIFREVENVQFPRIVGINDSLFTIRIMFRGVSTEKFLRIDRATGQIADTLFDSWIVGRNEDNEPIYHNSFDMELFSLDASQFISHQDSRFLGKIENRGILLLKNSYVERINKSRDFNDLRIELIDYTGRKNWDIPIDVSIKSLASTRAQICVSDSILWLLIYEKELHAFAIDFDGKILGRRVIQKELQRSRLHFMQALPIMGNRLIVSGPQISPKVVSIQNTLQGSAKLKYSDLIDNSGNFCTWDEVSLCVHSINESGIFTSTELAIEEGHKLDDYLISDKEQILFRHKYGNQGDELYNLKAGNNENGESDSWIQIDIPGYKSNLLDHSKYVLYASKTQSVIQSTTLYLLRYPSLEVDSVDFASEYLRFQEVGEDLFTCLKDTVLKLDLETLQIDTILLKGTDKLTHIYSYDNNTLGYYDPSYYEESEFWAAYLNDLEQVDTLRDFTPYKISGELGKLNENIVLLRSEKTSRFRSMSPKGGFYGMGNSDGAFLGEIILLDTSGKVAEQFDFSKTLQSTGCDMQLVNISSDIRHFLFKDSRTYYLTNRSFKPYFEFENDFFGFIHDKYILTSHRLLNQYELFPINGNVAIEMVREQGRLGEVRDFTPEEIEKYGLN